MFFNFNRRVDEDLERIRKANLPPEQAAAEAEAEAAQKKKRAAEPKVGFRDIFAMYLAVMSIVMPYALIFIGVLVAVVVLIFLL